MLLQLLGLPPVWTPPQPAHPAHALEVFVGGVLGKQQPPREGCRKLLDTAEQVRGTVSNSFQLF
eukprot:11337957-Alexandrium_andersonii.AAC.1